MRESYREFEARQWAEPITTLEAVMERKQAKADSELGHRASLQLKTENQESCYGRLGAVHTEAVRARWPYSWDE